jgi:hypothetical protein
MGDPIWRGGTTFLPTSGEKKYLYSMSPRVTGNLHLQLRPEFGVVPPVYAAYHKERRCCDSHLMA